MSRRRTNLPAISKEILLGILCFVALIPLISYVSPDTVPIIALFVFLLTAGIFFILRSRISSRILPIVLSGFGVMLFLHMIRLLTAAHIVILIALTISLVAYVRQS